MQQTCYILLPCPTESSRWRLLVWKIISSGKFCRYLVASSFSSPLALTKFIRKHDSNLKFLSWIVSFWCNYPRIHHYIILIIPNLADIWVWSTLRLQQYCSINIFAHGITLVDQTVAPPLLDRPHICGSVVAHELWKWVRKKALRECFFSHKMKCESMDTVGYWHVRSSLGSTCYLIYSYRQLQSL